MTVSELVDANGVALSTPTVTISLIKPDRTTESGTVTQDGTTYYSEFESDQYGKHEVVATATAGGTVWKDKVEVLISKI